MEGSVHEKCRMALVDKIDSALLWWLLLLSSSTVWVVDAVVPTVCVHNVTHSRICCPSGDSGDQPCGGPDRGYCAPVTIYQQTVPTPFLQDDRVLWPTKFFTHLCRCVGNHFGVACEECWYGWEGEHCRQRGKLRKRKNWIHHSEVEKEMFHKVMQLSFTQQADYMIMIEQRNQRSDPLRSPIFIPASVHYFIVYMHRFASRATLFDSHFLCAEYGLLDFNHDGSSFVTWHRYMLLFWERQLAKLAQKHFGLQHFAMPYWDFIDNRECEVCTNDMAGAEGELDEFGLRLDRNSIFYNWTEFCTEPTDGALCYGCHYNTNFAKITRHWNNYVMPTTNDLDYVMSLNKFYVPSEKDGAPCKSFHMALEGFCGRPGQNKSQMYMHNYVHNALDGSMCCSATATNDPLFPVIHANLDRIVEAWQKDHNPKVEDFPEDNVPPGHCRDCFMAGFLPPVRHSEIFTKRSHDLGYRYDNFEFGKEGRVYGNGHRRHPQQDHSHKRHFHHEHKKMEIQQHEDNHHEETH